MHQALAGRCQGSGPGWISSTSPLKEATSGIRLRRPQQGFSLSRFADEHVQLKGRYELPVKVLAAGGAADPAAPAAPHPQRSSSTAADVHEQLQQQLLQQQQQQPPSRRALQPAHRALAARLAAAAERQQRRQLQQQQQQQQGAGRHGSWSSRVAVDIRLVCQELSLPQSVAAALCAAAAKGSISCNPGILMSQLVRLLPLEAQLVPLLGGRQPGALAALLASHPPLLRCDPTSLAGNAAHVAQVLGPQAAAAAVRRYPQVLAVSPFRISASLATLQQLLGYSSAAAAAAAAARQPMLLLSTPDHLQQRWRQLQQLLPDVPEARLMQQLRRTPALLLTRPSTLAGKLRCLELLFSTTTAAAAGAATGAATGAGAAAPHGRVQQREGRPGCDPPPPAAAAGGLAAVAGLSQLQATGAASGVQEAQQHQQQQQLQQHQHQQQQEQRQQQRVLLVYKRHKLVYRLQRLQQLAAEQGPRHSLPTPPGAATHQLAGGSSSSWDASNSTDTTNATSSGGSGSGSVDARVQHLVLRVPGLLCLSPLTLASHVVQLQLLLGLGADDPRLARVLLLQPGLLTQAPTTLANKLALLVHLTGRGEAWVVDMVLRVPALLCLARDSVAAKWALLQACVAACGTWRAQLDACGPATLGMLLCYSTARLQRLAYVVHLAQEQQQQQEEGEQQEQPACGMAGSRSSGRRRRGAQHQHHQQQHQRLDLAAVPWRSLVQASDARFCQRFPGFRAWLGAQQEAHH